MGKAKVLKFLAALELIGSVAGSIAFCFTRMEQSAKIGIIVAFLITGIINCIVLTTIASNCEYIDYILKKINKKSTQQQLNESPKNVSTDFTVGDSVVLHRDFVAENDAFIKAGTIGHVEDLSNYSLPVLSFYIKGKKITTKVPRSLIEMMTDK